MSGADVRSAGAAALATVLGACALTPVFSSAAWLLPVVAVVLVVLAGGLLLRVGGPALWARLASGRPVPGRVGALGVALVPVGQLLLVFALLTARYAPGGAIGGVIPTRASLAELAGVLANGGAELREQATPALPLTGLLAMTTLFVGLIAVVVDLVAVAGREAALAGLGLLVLYCVPVATITGGIGFVAIAAPAVGLTLLLWTDQRRRVGSASRPPESGLASRLGTGTLAALRIGAAALVAGLVVGTVVPTLSEGSFATGVGGGSGGATGTSLDPVVKLTGQLMLPEPIDLLRMDTSVEDPGYLRAVTLDDYDSTNGWTLSNLAGEESIAGNDRLAPLPPRQQARPVTATIRAIHHADRFLPVPASPLSVRMQNEQGQAWRYDPATGTVFGRDVTSAGRSYTVVATEPRPAAALLAASQPLPADNGVQLLYTELPELDPRVLAAVAEATGDAVTPYERVHNIHAYLSDRANGFRYSLATEPGTSGDDLVDFLRLRRGYCEQYAGAMAVMVRAAGVPARVALGYTPGQQQHDGSRLITSDDAHAWVEVYFQGLGWVPFDPTPIASDRAVDLPWAPRADAVTSADTGLPVPVPSAPTAAPPTTRQDRATDGAPTAQPGQGTGGTSWPLPAGAGLLLVVLVGLGTPAGLRVLQRRRRSATGSAGALWDELVATAVDLGVRLQPAWTPRRAAHELAEVVARGGDPSGRAADAVLRLARAEELACYARAVDGAADPELGSALRTARHGLLRSAPRGVRLRAVLWPASLMTGSGARLADRARRRLVAPARLRRPRSV
ncbi:MAG: Transglutaminase-like enzyme predicted cysteine protease [Blastococcus sp.]|nr:Transglutaminase-like enzyme predicted cysteine protease [Blastococcus sp.]